MKRSDAWPILTLFDRMASLFVAGVAVIALLVAGEFLQAKSHVTKVGRPRVIRTMYADTVVTAYIDKGQTPPQIVPKTISRYTFRTAWEWVEPPTPYPCPHSPQNWALLLEDVGLIERVLEEYDPPAELPKATQLINVVASKFPSGEPSAACAITLELATTGALNEEELSVAADILRVSEHIAVSVSVRNDSNAVAEEVTVIAKEEGFRCEDEEPENPGQCTPFPLQIEEERTVVFRSKEPGLFPDKSDAELAEMFYQDWLRWKGPDTPRILRLLGRAGLFTVATVILDCVRKQRRYLVERFLSWGEMLFIIALLVPLLVMLWAIISFALLLLI